MSQSISPSSPFPTGDQKLDNLHQYGDPLESLICEDLESLQIILIPYSQVWSGHIRPHRKEDGAFLDEKWQKFGARHYTALVRLHHAMVAKNQILDLCKSDIMDDDYALLLQVHSACAGFYDNLGAAIDNFVRAREEAQKALSIEAAKRKEKTECKECGAVMGDEKFAARTLSSAESPTLFYAFERRHQFIHSIIVPQKIVGGEILFNLKHFDDVATDWLEDRVDYTRIDSKIQSDWESILSEFGNRWGRLYSLLQEHDKIQLGSQASAPVGVKSNDAMPPKQVDFSSLSGQSLTASPLSGSRPTSPSGNYMG